MFHELLTLFDQLLFQPKITNKCDAGKEIAGELHKRIRELEEKEKRIDKLTADRERTEAEKRVLTEENEKLISQLQRRDQFVVFPLTKLPRVVIFEIVQKLKHKHRRHLMQSCSTFHTLLYGRTAADVDCRLPARIHGSLSQYNHDLKLSIRVLKHTVCKSLCSQHWSIPAASPNLPTSELVPFVEMLADNFLSEEFHVHLSEISENAWSHAVIVQFINEVLECFPVKMSSSDVRVTKWVTLLLECTHTTSLCLENLSRAAIRKYTSFRARHGAVVTIMKEAAAKKGIPVLFDMSGPEDEFVLRLHVSDDNEKCLTICG